MLGLGLGQKRSCMKMPPQGSNRGWVSGWSLAHVHTLHWSACLILTKWGYLWTAQFEANLQDMIYCTHPLILFSPSTFFLCNFANPTCLAAIVVAHVARFSNWTCKGLNRFTPKTYAVETHTHLTSKQLQTYQPVSRRNRNDGLLGIDGLLEICGHTSAINYILVYKNNIIWYYNVLYIMYS